MSSHLWLRKKYYRSFLTGGCILFVSGMLAGAEWHRRWLFPLPQLSSWRHQQLRKSAEINLADAARPFPSESTNDLLRIRTTYLPSYSIVTNESGLEVLENQYGEHWVKAQIHEVALVLVDTWNNRDPEEGGRIPELLVRQRDVLEKARQCGMTVIHAPNHPVVENYEQYHDLKRELQDYHTAFPSTKREEPVYMNWPSRDHNPLWQAQWTARRAGRQAPYQLSPLPERDISRYLTPSTNEYVVESHAEFRYVLWKHRIRALLYIGGALNACMLHRDTGINMLGGIDSTRSSFNIIVVGDASHAAASPFFAEDDMRKAMLDYYRMKIALVADSKDIVWPMLQGQSE